MSVRFLDCVVRVTPKIVIDRREGDGEMVLKCTFVELLLVILLQLFFPLFSFFLPSPSFPDVTFLKERTLIRIVLQLNS